MRRSVSMRFSLMVACALLACGQPVQPGDGGSDAGGPDAAFDDAGFDGGDGDGGDGDAGFDDAGTPDASIADGGDDGGQPDAGIPDAGEVDAGPPPIDTIIVSAPMGTITTDTASVTFTASEPDASFECALDSRVFTPCASPQAPAGLGNGLHLFSVRATSADGGTVDATPAEASFNVALPGPARIRVMASNLTSGNLQSYDPGDGVRLIAGLKPDVVLMQEFKCTVPRDCVDRATGPNFVFMRESGPAIRIPNGIISRYPILDAGQWDDPIGTDREFAWAQLDVPGPQDLFVVSVHLSTSNATNRNAEAVALVNFVKANVPAGALLALGGDFNTDTRGENPTMATFGQVVMTDAGAPADQIGNGFTNATRTRPYDWVLANPSLQTRAVPLVMPSRGYPNGLVLDTRVYTPLSDVPGVDGGESAAPNMQHMGVARDFLLPN